MENEITGRSSFRSCMRHPALAGFGEYVLPWEKGILTKLIPPLSIGYLCRCLGYDTATVVDGIRFMIDCGQRKKLRLLPLYPGRTDAGRQDTRLIFIPSDAGRPFALICAGGGFASVNLMQEAFPIAAELHRAGYPVFILKYRVGQQPGDQPGTADRHDRAVEDLSAALCCIADCGAELDISPERYSLWGFSAGGRAICLWNEDGRIGRTAAGLPAPAAMVLLYPGAEASVQPGLDLVEHGVYLAVGRHDKLIGQEGVSWCETFARRLSQSGKAVLFEEFECAPHGFGLGVGTDAEGWFHRALSFWQSQ